MLVKVPGTLKDREVIFVPGKGYPGSPIVIVGEAPGAQEVVTGKPFTGKAGKFLHSSLEQAGFLTSDIYFTNAVKVKPPGNRAPNKQEIDSWLLLLRGELTMYLRDTIILLGRVAQYAYSQLSLSERDWVSSKPQVYSLPHPSWVQRFKSKDPEWIDSLKRIKHNTYNYSEEQTKYYKEDRVQKTINLYRDRK